MTVFIGMSEVVELDLPEDGFGELDEAVYREAATERPSSRLTVVFSAALAAATLSLSVLTGPGDAIERGWSSSWVFIDRGNEPADDPSATEAAGYRHWFEGLPNEDVDDLVDESKFVAMRWDGSEFKSA